jgi:hypothetical protein
LSDIGAPATLSWLWQAVQRESSTLRTLQYGVLAPAGFVAGFDAEVGVLGVDGVLGVAGFEAAAAEPAAPDFTGDAFGAAGVVLAAEPASPVALGELTGFWSAEPSSEPHAAA